MNEPEWQRKLLSTSLSNEHHKITFSLSSRKLMLFPKEGTVVLSYRLTEFMSMISRLSMNLDYDTN